MAKTYTCPHAEIEWEGITCKKDGLPCGHVRWCMEKGRVILTEQALNCTRRKEESEGDKRKNAEKKYSNAVSGEN